MRQTLIDLHLTVSSKVARPTGAEVVIEMVLRRKKESDNHYTNARKKMHDWIDPLKHLH